MPENDSEATPLEVSCSEIKALLEDEASGLKLIDCRDPSEHALVNLPGALLVPMQETPARVAEIAALEGRVVVYCHHGMRSAQTAQWLRENGVPNAQSLAGGIDAWAVEIEPGMPRY